MQDIEHFEMQLADGNVEITLKDSLRLFRAKMPNVLIDALDYKVSVGCYANQPGHVYMTVRDIVYPPNVTVGVPSLEVCLPEDYDIDPVPEVPEDLPYIAEFAVTDMVRKLVACAKRQNNAIQMLVRQMDELKSRVQDFEIRASEDDSFQNLVENYKR